MEEFFGFFLNAGFFETKITKIILPFKIIKLFLTFGVPKSSQKEKESFDHTKMHI